MNQVRFYVPANVETDISAKYRISEAGQLDRPGTCTATIVENGCVDWT